MAKSAAKSPEMAARLCFSAVQIIDRDLEELAIDVMRALVELPAELAARRIAIVVGDDLPPCPKEVREACAQAYREHFDHAHAPPPPSPPSARSKVSPAHPSCAPKTD